MPSLSTLEPRLAGQVHAQTLEGLLVHLGQDDGGMDLAATEGAELFHSQFCGGIGSSADGQGNQQSDFINCVAWRNQAEFISRYFKKGSSICITGSLQTRTWTDQQNNKRYITEVVVDEVSFVDSKGDNSQYQSSSDNFGAPSYSTETAPDFEVISADQDLPF